MWKILNESVEGTSHRRSGAPCQDASFCTPFSFPGDEGIILACADGAGSASASEIGSRLACLEIVRLVHKFLECAPNGVTDITRETVADWFSEIHTAIAAEAQKRELAPRDLACTLLVAVAGRNRAAFAQIGDGAIVVNEQETFRPVFWPETGEYQNTTFFISDPSFPDHVQVEILEKPIEEIALLSDGLQMLALNFATKSAHQPFFGPRFKILRSTEDPQELQIPMRQFLDSEGVNARTDDDKTLILATRMPTNVTHSP
jgi:hypothetical protein